MPPKKQKHSVVSPPASTGPDLYAELGLARTASIDDIKRAYRRLALQCHPDKCPGDEAAHERFQRVSLAYSVLSDEQKRRYYDQTGTTEGLDISPDEFMDMFRSLLVEIIGGADMIRDMLSCFTPRELARLPPFPFPKELFPPGTFPPGLRFSSKGLKGMPIQVEELIQSGDLQGMFAAMSMPGSSPFGERGGGGGGGGRSRFRSSGAPATAAAASSNGSKHRNHGSLFYAQACDGGYGDADHGSGMDGSSDSDWTDVSEGELRELYGAGGLDGADGREGRGAGVEQQQRQSAKRPSPPSPAPPVSAGGPCESASAVSAGPHTTPPPQPRARPPMGSGTAAAGRAANPGASNTPTASTGGSLPGPLVRDWMLAARSCDVGALSSLLVQAPQLLGSRGPGMGHTALHWCAAKGCVEGVKLLLGQGLDVNVRNDDGATPLHAAARNGQLEAVEALLAWRQPRSPTSQGEGAAAGSAAEAPFAPPDGFMAACDLRPCVSLAGAPCDARAVDGEGRTALQLALEFGHPQIAALLQRSAAAQSKLQSGVAASGTAEPAAPRIVSATVQGAPSPPAERVEVSAVHPSGGAEGPLAEAAAALVPHVAPVAGDGMEADPALSEAAGEASEAAAAGGASDWSHTATAADCDALCTDASGRATNSAEDCTGGACTPGVADKEPRGAPTGAEPAAAGLAEANPGSPASTAVAAVAEELEAGSPSPTVQQPVTLAEATASRAPEVSGEDGFGTEPSSSGAAPQCCAQASSDASSPLGAAVGVQAAAMDPVSTGDDGQTERPSRSPPQSSPPPPPPPPEAPSPPPPSPPPHPGHGRDDMAAGGGASGQQQQQQQHELSQQGPDRPEGRRTGGLTPEEKAARRAALLAADEAADRDAERREAQKVAAAEAAALAAGLRSREEGKDWLEAARRGDLPALKRMLGANPRLLQYLGQGTNFAFTSHTALHWAVAKGHTQAARWLLEQGADPDVPNAAGATPLHAAASQGADQCARLLVVEAAAKMGVADALGETARDILLRRDTDGRSGGSGARLASELELLARIAALRDAPGGEAEWTPRTMRSALVAAGVNVAGLLERHELVDACRQLIAKQPPRIRPAPAPLSSPHPPARPSPEPTRLSPTAEAPPHSQASARQEEARGATSLSAAEMEQLAEALAAATTGPEAAGAAGSSGDRPPPAAATAAGAASGTGVDATAAAASDSAKQRGNEAFSRGDYPKAVSHYTMAMRLSLAPSAVLCSNRSAAYSGMAYYGKAQADAEEAIRLDPAQPKYRCRLGVALLGQRQWREAEAAFRAALAIDPAYAAAVRGLADVRAAVAGSGLSDD